MRIYTSYFARRSDLERCGIVPISIARWKPRWYTGLAYLDVAPKAFMLKDDITRSQYIEGYNRYVLDALDARKILDDIARLSGGRDAALLCYEKPGDFCHRHLLADWLREKTGADIEEFVTDSRGSRSAGCQDLTLF